MIRRFAIALATILALLTALTACQPPQFLYEVFNNTGLEVSIAEGAKRILIPPGKARRTEHGAYGLALATPSDGLWTYAYGVLPTRTSDPGLEDFNADGGGFWRRPLLRLQLQPDGSLYAVGRRERPPLTAFRRQPPGFPLTPGVNYDKCPDCQAWNNPAAPFAIFGNTHYVGTRGLSSILVTSNTGHVPIDGGLAQSAPHIAANIRKLGFRVEDVKLILNSHVHFDHAGGIAALQRMSGAQVAASARSAAVLRTGVPALDDPQHGAIAPIETVSDVRIVADGAVVRVGDLALTMRATPGHT
ncbi:MAG: metallo-beta-lactamase, partial [Steroidobacteraceae bacterium]